MPRLSDEEDSSSSDSGLDFSSSDDDSIPDNLPAEPQNNNNNNSNSSSILVGGSYSTDYFVTGGSHVSSKLVDNRSKRKLRGGGSDGRPAKSQRLANDVELTPEELDALNHQDSADSDYETAEEDDEEEEEDDDDNEDDLLPLDPETPQVSTTQAVQSRLEPLQSSSVVRQHPAWPQPQAQSSSTQVVQQPSSGTGITVYQLMCRNLPYLRIRKTDVPNQYRYLTDLPVKRVPVVKRSFNIAKPQNTVAYLVQASGELLPDRDACYSCRTQGGVFSGCVVTRDPILNESLQGACARCWYGRQGSKCSFRKGAPPITNTPSVPAAAEQERPSQSESQSQTPVPVPQVPSVSYKHLQRESQHFQQAPKVSYNQTPKESQAFQQEKRAFPQSSQVRTIIRDTQRPSPSQNGTSNSNGTTTVRKETPVFPPSYNAIPFIRRIGSDDKRAQGPQVPQRPQPTEGAKKESTTTGSTSGTGSGNHFAELPVELPNFVSQMQERAGKNGGASSVSDLMHDRIDSWTKTYEDMSTRELLVTQKQLYGWMAECNARLAEYNAQLAALTTVMIQKRESRDGQATITNGDGDRDGNGN